MVVFLSDLKRNSFHSKAALIALLFLSLFTNAKVPWNIECYIGYGQRGAQTSNGISWRRTCLNSKYCFEAVTNDIGKMKKLFDYPWDPYYMEFYVTGCGGEFGTPKQFHPYKKQPNEKHLRLTPRSIQMNISTPKTLTVQGGKEGFDMNYECRRQLCNAKSLPTSSGM